MKIIDALILSESLIILTGLGCVGFILITSMMEIAHSF
ncbi:hypothetical protein AusDCA_3296 [Desulfitobacterium sp. AusDCA]